MEFYSNIKFIERQKLNFNEMKLENEKLGNNRI